MRDVNIQVFSLPAGADFRATGPHRFVTVNATGQSVAPAAGGSVVGVLANNPNTGQAASIVHSGLTGVTASAAIATGANVATTADGRAVTATAGQEIVGICTQGASAAGAIAQVLLRGAGRNA